MDLQSAKKSLEHFENQACAFDVDQYVQAGTLNQYCDGFGDILNMFAFLNTVRFHLKTCIMIKAFFEDCSL